MKMKLFVHAAQIAYFLGNIDLSDSLKVAGLIKETLGETLDGTPTILPLPADAPIEIPRIIYPSKNNVYVCNVSLNRVDFIYKLTDADTGIEVDKFLEEFEPKVKVINDLLFSKLQVTCNRIGTLFNYNALPSEGGLILLKNKLLQNPKDEANELQFHKLTQKSIQDMKINNWVRFVSSDKNLNSGENHLVIISDINTSQNEIYTINTKNAHGFFKESVELSMKTISEFLD